MKELADKLGEARDKLSFSEKQQNHKRGDFPSVSIGTSFGGGSKVRSTLFYLTPT